MSASKERIQRERKRRGEVVWSHCSTQRTRRSETSDGDCFLVTLRWCHLSQRNKEAAVSNELLSIDSDKLEITRTPWQRYFIAVLEQKARTNWTEEKMWRQRYDSRQACQPPLRWLCFCSPAFCTSSRLQNSFFWEEALCIEFGIFTTRYLYRFYILLFNIPFDCDCLGFISSELQFVSMYQVD